MKRKRRKAYGLAMLRAAGQRLGKSPAELVEAENRKRMHFQRKARRPFS